MFCFHHTNRCFLSSVFYSIMWRIPDTVVPDLKSNLFIKEYETQMIALTGVPYIFT